MKKDQTTLQERQGTKIQMPMLFSMKILGNIAVLALAIRWKR